MKKYSGHKIKKFPDGHDIRGECVLNPCRPPMKGGHTHNHTYNVGVHKSLWPSFIAKNPNGQKE